MSMFGSIDGLDYIPMCKLTKKNITKETAAKVTVEVTYKPKNKISNIKTCALR